jgi:hypothetical protein
VRKLGFIMRYNVTQSSLQCVIEPIWSGRGTYSRINTVFADILQRPESGPRAPVENAGRTIVFSGFRGIHTGYASGKKRREAESKRARTSTFRDIRNPRVLILTVFKFGVNSRFGIKPDLGEDKITRSTVDLCIFPKHRLGFCRLCFQN